MALETALKTQGFELTDVEERHVRHHLDGLERRLVHRPEPTATLMLKRQPQARRIDVSLRVQLGPLGSHLISHQSAETADRAVKLAVEDVERQLERQDAQQAGEQAYGIPSRRLPAQGRPNPYTSRSKKAAIEEGRDVGRSGES
jgi:ribosome-associated translation inhibitor RaiA